MNYLRLLAATMALIATAAWPPVLLAAHHALHPRAVTLHGRLLWEFETLLRASFGDRPVYVTSNMDFSCSGTCIPAAKYSPYRYTFRITTPSDLMLARTTHASGLRFGNFATAVLINGHMIRCEQREKRFLITFRNAVSFTLGCLAPVR